MKRVGAMAALGLAMVAATVTFPVAASAASPAQLSGVVQSGGTTTTRPLAGVTVTLLEATTAAPRALGQATTDEAGRFTIRASQDSSAGILYLSAEIAQDVDLVAVLGPSLPAAATVNELTTVGAGFALAQFVRDGSVSGDPFALRLAAGMNDAVVTVATGASSPVLLSSPNADETISLRMTRSLANLLAACVEDRSATAAFLAATKEPRGRPPVSTFQALANLARDPARNAKQIGRLTRLRTAYLPALEHVPDSWSVAVKVNDTGDDDNLFGGPANLAFDDQGYAWITNNVVQGYSYSSTFVAVLKPNGQPADGAGGTPTSPLSGGGILGTGFGVTIDAVGNVWFGNFGWGGSNPPSGTSISRFSPGGAPLSDSGEGGAVDRVQGMATDPDGNVWVTSFGNDSVVVFPDGDVHAPVTFPEYSGSQPFDVAIGPDGAAWVSNSGGLAGIYPSSVARFTVEGGILRRTVLRFVGKSLKGLDVDSQGIAWVASLDDDAVFGIRPDGTVLGPFGGGGITGPWDVTVDGEDNLWVTNFGPTKVNNTLSEGRLSKLCGIREEACPPGMKTGDPITPPSGYTMPSAGSQVLLHDGTPLYGKNAPPSFVPMMRQTASVIDRAGNIWTLNNWKPNFDVDAPINRGNPGGDGIVIFLGLAPPAR